MIRTVNNSLLLVIFCFFATSLTAQKISPDEKIFIKQINEADGYFIYDEDYRRASVIYDRLFKLNPENHNLAYKLGVCYLNMQGSELKSLNLLRFASENFVRDVDYSAIGEPAPFDVLYYLAFSCQVNLELEEAIDNYQRYKSLLQVREASEIEYINLQIEACQNIIEATEEGIILIKNLFTPWFSEYRNAVNPIISQNDSVLAFTVKSESGNTIYLSKKVNGKWEQPGDITPMMGKYNDMFTNSLRGDGKQMIICRNNGYKGDLYITSFKNGKWGKISKLGKNINTRYWESHGTLSKDGRRLYFASNKPGGYGSLDIYYSDLQENNTFGRAVNLGQIINTELEENTPFVDDEGSLYFSSTGHIGFGGYDIFFSAFENKHWTEPIHLSFPLNTPADNLHYVPYGSFNTGIYSMPVNDTASSYTVFGVTHGIRPETDKVIARGNIILGDGMSIDAKRLRLELYEGGPGKEKIILKSDSSGRFSYGLDSSLYSLIISYPNYKSDTVTISIPESFTGSAISIKRELIPVSVAKGEFFSVKNILFGFDSHELDREAKIELEKIIPVLISNPSLKIELKGYTDAIGPEEYNLRLSDSRALNVNNYLVKSGVDQDRMMSFAEGESEFISKNTKSDGSDNPEGRKYNRRVSISVINNGYEIFVESTRFIPNHLKKMHRISYYVVVEESDVPLSTDFFKSSQLGELTMVTEIKTPNNIKYCVGEFTSRTDAINFLSTVRDYGYNDAYIADEYELTEENIDSSNTHLYTIQIHALKTPVENEFENLRNVRVIKGSDGFYRYVVGEYRGYSRALEALKTIKSCGYPQAYIKDFSVLEEQTISKEK